MENCCPEGTQDQLFTPTSGDTLGRDVLVSCHDKNRKHSRVFYPLF